MATLKQTESIYQKCTCSSFGACAANIQHYQYKMFGISCAINRIGTTIKILSFRRPMFTTAWNSSYWPPMLISRRRGLHFFHQSIWGLAVRRLHLWVTLRYYGTGFGFECSYLFWRSIEGGLTATSQQRELVELYRKTVLVAFKEVGMPSSTKAGGRNVSCCRTAMNFFRRL